jgi:hypothetical protein
MRRIRAVHRLVLVPLCVVLSPLLPVFSTTSAAAPIAETLYSYAFPGVTTSPVPNGASVNTAVGLNLVGNWAPSAVGVDFTGDTYSRRSVGYARPSSGPTLSAAASDAVGVAAKFRYKAPTSGSCFSDSPNVTQIGRFGAGVTQLKVQLSACSGTTAGVYAECRVAGSNSPSRETPRRATQALVNGATYVVRCSKGRDPATGQTTLVLETTRMVSTGNTKTVDAFLITRPGAMTSTAYLSVANKYPLPLQVSNTDQFNGDVAKVAYCRATSSNALAACLDAEVPQG